MIIKLREKELSITKEEAQKINEALLAGAEFVQIGDELLNSKYIIGIFNSQEPEPQTDRLISAPGPREKDLRRIGEMLEKVKKELENKGILVNK